MDQEDVATGKKNAFRKRAVIAFIDESGLLLAPLARRTWAPRGDTPVLSQRGRHTEKISIIGAVTCSPTGRSSRFVFRLHRNQNITKLHVRRFLCQLRGHISPKRHIIVLWDRLNSHRSANLVDYARRHNMTIEFFPAYSPELNPAEYAWGYLKMNPLANYAPHSTQELAGKSRRAGRKLQRAPNLIRSFLAQSSLFFS
jgi:transposase